MDDMLDHEERPRLLRSCVSDHSTFGGTDRFDTGYSLNEAI